MLVYEAYFAEIEKVVNSPAFARYFQSMQAAAPPLREWSSPCALKDLLQRGAGFTERTRDTVLAAVLGVPEQLRSREQRTLLTFLCRPLLIAIFHRCRSWSAEPHELWHDLLWCFLYAVAHLDVRRRSDRIAQKIFNDTYHRLYSERSKEWDSAGREQPTAPDELPERAADYRDALDEYLDAQKESQSKTRAMLDALTRLYESGRLAERDYLLLVGTEVNGRTVASLATGQGDSYAAVKKRRQRLLQSLGDALPARSAAECPLDFENTPFSEVEGENAPVKRRKP